MTVAEVDAMLTGEGGFFETEEATVNGVAVTTLKNRAPHLRALLQNSANHGGDGSSRYYVFDDGREATFAENIAHADTAEKTMTQWMNSPPHRANILHRRFSHHGLGVAAGRADDGSYQIRWVQIFASYH